jgi:hypothetical protein
MARPLPRYHILGGQHADLNPRSAMIPILYAEDVRGGHHDDGPERLRDRRGAFACTRPGARVPRPWEAGWTRDQFLSCHGG